MRGILVTGNVRHRQVERARGACPARFSHRRHRRVRLDGRGHSGGRWWDEERISGLLAEDRPTLYMSGTVSNQGHFYDRFDAVVLVSAPADVLLERVSSRSTNDYGSRSRSGS